MSSRPSTCATNCRQAQRLARRHLRSVPMPGETPRRLSRSAWRTSPIMCDESFDADPSTPRPTLTPASR